MAVTKRDFPKLLYVAIDEDGKNKYFVADSGADTFAIIGDSRLIAMYELSHVVTLATKIELKETK